MMCCQSFCIWALYISHGVKIWKVCLGEGSGQKNTELLKLNSIIFICNQSNGQSYTK